MSAPKDEGNGEHGPAGDARSEENKGAADKKNGGEKVKNIVGTVVEEAL